MNFANNFLRRRSSSEKKLRKHQITNTNNLNDRKGTYIRYGDKKLQRSICDRICCRKSKAVSIENVYVMSNISSFASLLALFLLIVVGMLSYLKLNSVIYPETFNTSYNFMKDLSFGYYKGLILFFLFYL